MRSRVPVADDTGLKQGYTARYSAPRRWESAAPRVACDSQSLLILHCAQWRAYSILVISPIFESSAEAALMLNRHADMLLAMLGMCFMVRMMRAARASHAGQWRCCLNPLPSGVVII